MKQTIAKALVAGTAAIMWLVGLTYAANFTDSQVGTDGINVAGSTNVSATASTTEPALLTTIKRAINLVLGFLGLIALCILLRGGFQMVTAAGDDKKYSAGFTILRQSGIGLIFIGLAALFVNLIFWIIGSIV